MVATSAPIPALTETKKCMLVIFTLITECVASVALFLSLTLD